MRLHSPRPTHHQSMTIRLRVAVWFLLAFTSLLMASAVQAGLLLTRYEVVRPSLEDVFLQLVGEGEA